MRGRWAALSAMFLAGCTSEGTLIVQVRSDLLPGREMAAVVVEVTPPGEAARETRTDASAAQDWGRGVRVAEQNGLAPGSYALVVRAVDRAGATLVSRPVRATVEGGLRVVTVLLTRSCAGVECPAAGDDASLTACLGGRCVATDCTEESTEGCGPPACATAADYPAPTATCAQVECTASGACAVRADHAACADGRVCAADAGCVAVDCDPGEPFESGPDLTADELVMVFNAGVQSSDPQRLFLATRPDRAAPFGPAEEITGLDPPGASQHYASLSADGLTLYYGVGIDPIAIWVATRASRDEPFTGGEPVLGLNDAMMSEAADPDLSPDGTELYYNLGDSASATLYVAPIDCP